MNEAIIFAAGSLLVMMLVAFSFTGDLKNATRETNATPTYCTESHPDYDQKKCEILHNWWRLKEELVLRTSEWAWECKCPKKQEKSTEKPEQAFERELCEEVCGADHGLQSSLEKVCDPESADFSTEECRNNSLYKWLNDSEWTQQQEEDPLHKWRRLQEERALRELEWEEKGCKCSEVPESEKAKKEECEQACGLKPKTEFDNKQIPECDLTSKDFDIEKCQAEDPLHRWLPTQKERPANTQESGDYDCLGECLKPPTGLESDELLRWRKGQCERVCQKTNDTKQE